MVLALTHGMFPSQYEAIFLFGVPPEERQCLVRHLELLHRGKEDTVRLPVFQQLLQMPSAVRLNRRLAQKVLSHSKLAEQLIVEIVAVCDHHDGRAVHGFLQKVRKEYHGK